MEASFFRSLDAVNDAPYRARRRRRSPQAIIDSVQTSEGHASKRSTAWRAAAGSAVKPGIGRDSPEGLAIDGVISARVECAFDALTSWLRGVMRVPGLDPGIDPRIQDAPSAATRNRCRPGARIKSGRDAEKEGHHGDRMRIPQFGLPGRFGAFAPLPPGRPFYDGLGDARRVSARGGAVPVAKVRR
jgi:hypothetical protein